MQLYTDFPLSKIIYYKIGGIAKTLLKIQNKEDLLKALDYIEKNKILRVLPLGMGANLLVSDDIFDGIVLWFSKPSPSLFSIQNSAIESFSSNTLDELIQFSLQNNLVGLEWAGGFPSTIGAAARGNVGAFGGEIKDSVDRIEYIDFLDVAKGIQIMQNVDCNFSYRNSIFKENKNLIIASVYFSLKKAEKKQVKNAYLKYYSNIEYRKKNHPLDYPSCGSVFKNITKKEEVEKIVNIWADVEELSKTKWHNKIAMGYVIKRLGFCGFTLGGAKVSEKHCNYILNIRNASFKDILEIIEKIKEKFNQVFGFYPELEVEIVQ